MVFNDHLSELLDRFKTNVITKEDVLTQVNNLVDYVQRSESEDKVPPKKPRK